MVGLVQLVEADRLATSSAEKFDWKRDQTKCKVSLPDRGSHPFTSAGGVIRVFRKYHRKRAFSNEECLSINTVVSVNSIKPPSQSPLRHPSHPELGFISRDIRRVVCITIYGLKSMER